MIKFIKVDADNIGDGIELALLDGNVNRAQEIHQAVQQGIQNVKQIINAFPGWKILMIGCDDILVEISSEDKIVENLDLVRKRFALSCGYTLSIGIGNTLQEALINLTKAKLSGKDTVIGL